MEKKKSFICVFGLSTVTVVLVLTLASFALNNISHADENPNQIIFSKSNLFTQSDTYNTEEIGSLSASTTKGNPTHFAYKAMKTSTNSNYIMDMAAESEDYPESYFYNTDYQNIGPIRGMRQFSMTFDVENPESISSPKVDVGIYYSKASQSYEAWPERLSKVFENISPTLEGYTITYDFDDYKPNYLLVQNESSFEIHIRKMEIAISPDCELSKPVLTTLKTEGGTININEKTEHKFQDEVHLIATPNDGYKFMKWIRVNDNGSDGAILSKDASYKYIMPNEDETIKAVFAKQYTITYKESSKHNNPLTYTSSDEIILESALDDKGGTSYFAGWQNKDGDIVSKIERGTQGDIELTAIWESAVYDVTLENTTGIKSFKYASETGYELLPDGEKSGCHFYYWKDASGNRVDNIEPKTTGNITLTAVYIEESDEWKKSHGVIPVVDNIENPTYVTYGMYPISQAVKVNDPNSELSLALDNTPPSDTIGKFSQVIYHKGEFYYCEMNARNNGELLKFHNGNTVGAPGSFNYYKFEPIKWNVFGSPSDVISLRSQYSVFCTNFNTSSTGGSARMNPAYLYENSIIKDKLREDFFLSAFGKSQYNDDIIEHQKEGHRYPYTVWIPTHAELPGTLETNQIESSDFCFATSNIELTEKFVSPFWLTDYNEEYVTVSSVECDGNWYPNSATLNHANQEIEIRYLGAVPVIRMKYPFK